MMTFETTRASICALLFLASSSLCAAQNGDTDAKAVEVPEKVMAQRLINIVTPTLPDGALGKKCSNALVMVKVTIDESGKVTNPQVVSGYAELRDSAITAIRGWTYKPYEQHGHAVAVHTKISLFYLGNGESFPMYAPDGKGGVKGGNMLPLPPDCGPGPVVKHVPSE